MNANVIDPSVFEELKNVEEELINSNCLEFLENNELLDILKSNPDDLIRNIVEEILIRRRTS